MWSIYEVIHFWTAVVDESEEWSSQYIFQFKQLERRSLKKKKKKIRASTGFEPGTWATKPHIGSEVNLLSSYLSWGDNRSSKMNHFIYNSRHFTPYGRYEKKGEKEKGEGEGRRVGGGGGDGRLLNKPLFGEDSPQGPVPYP